MITFGLNYYVKDEYSEQFLKVSNEVLIAMNQLKGHVSTVLYEDVNKPHSYLIYSEWETNEDFKDFMTSEAFKNVKTMGVEMLKERPKHQIYESRKMGH